MQQIRHLKPAGKAIFKDRYTKKANELLIPWPESRKAPYALVGLPLSKSSISHSGASFAPGVIRAALASYTTYSGEFDKDLVENIIDFGDLYMDPTAISRNQEWLYEGMLDIYHTEAAQNWFLLGGDHSISYASIRAFAEQRGKVGIIQFDAHHDLRNVDDGGPTNGTPFRRLLEEQVIDGSNLVQIGIRDFMNAKAYHTYADEHGVQLYSMADIETRTIHAILQEEIERLSKRVDSIYLSVDMDVLDQAFAPGCPAIGPGGMDSRTLVDAIFIAAQTDKVQAMDIVEIDPTIDFRNMTSKVAAYLLLTYMKGMKCRNG
ncbi:formimidoylglutamase [Virgibacillus sp. LDC-1]|uniref:formimidoylglutamase n=1 Tax=Virgibacillus sp. LDC-1 TaxID=3039856 RepID=UPI0024DE7D53|nr:formimidoylglutamase [Virgibacillus sp. LDC-1]